MYGKGKKATSEGTTNFQFYRHFYEKSNRALKHTAPTYTPIISDNDGRDRHITGSRSREFDMTVIQDNGRDDGNGLALNLLYTPDSPSTRHAEVKLSIVIAIQRFARASTFMCKFSIYYSNKAHLNIISYVNDSNGSKVPKP